MGTQVRGAVAGVGEVHADLASDHAVFRGAFAGEVPYREMRASAQEGLLRLEFRGLTAVLVLGDKAAAWARKVAEPPSRLDKLGVKPGTALAAIAIDDAGFLEEARHVARWAEVDQAAVVLRGARSRDDLGDLDDLERRLAPKAALWIVYPKGGKGVRESDVLAAGRAAGLKDVKVARFSETHTALKFVRPARDP